MSALPSIRLAALNLLRNRRRSSVTLGIAALGSAALLLAGGFALYTYESLAQAAARTTGHLIIGRAAHFTQEEDVPLQHGLDDVAALTARLQGDAAVRQVLPRVDFSGLISNGDKSTVMMAAGIAPDAEFAIKGPFLSVRAGRVLTSRDVRQVMLGEGLARSLKAAPGASLTLMASTTEGALNAVDVTVAGLVATGVPEVDKRLVYTDIATAQALLATPRVSSLGVFLDAMAATPAAQQRLAAALPALTVRTWLDQAFFYRGVKDLYNRIFGALGFIIAAIVVFVVANAMAMTIIERTREIGTLRAMGTPPRRLIGALALEGALLGGAGALAGALLAAAVAVALMVFPVNMPPPPGSTQGYPLQVALEPWLYAATLAGMGVLATLASAAVARRTVRIPIVEALAHV